jgi:hypothetical protein
VRGQRVAECSPGKKGRLPPNARPQARLDFPRVPVAIDVDDIEPPPIEALHGAPVHHHFQCARNPRQGAVVRSRSTRSSDGPRRLSGPECPYALNENFDKGQLDNLLRSFDSAVPRQIDRSISQKLCQELLDTNPSSISRATMGQLAKWCNTNNPLYWYGMEVARKISQMKPDIVRLTKLRVRNGAEGPLTVPERSLQRQRMIGHDEERNSRQHPSPSGRRI